MQVGSMIIETSACPGDAARITDIIIAYNSLHTPRVDRVGFCLVAREEDRIVGGALGWTDYHWCYVDILALLPEARGSGNGAQLLTAVENLARDRNCIGVYLYSYSFQSPRFYERCGYTPFGKIEDLPPGHTQVWLSKRLT